MVTISRRRAINNMGRDAIDGYNCCLNGKMEYPIIHMPLKPVKANTDNISLNIYKFQSLVV